MTYSAYNGLNLQAAVTTPDQGVAGQALLDQKNVAFLNSGATSAQTVLITVGTAAASTDYTFNIGGVTNSVQYVVADGDPWNNVAAGTAITAAIMQARLVSFIERYYPSFSVVTTGATQITLTNNTTGINTPVTVSGGGAGFAVTTNTAANNDTNIPYGVVVVAGGFDESGRLGQLASATGQRVIGICRRGQSDARYEYAEAQAYGIAQDGIRPGADGTAMSQGQILAIAEAAFTGNETGAFFRHSPDGALTALSRLAPAAGTGLDALAVGIEGPSFTTADGVILVPVSINLP